MEKEFGELMVFVKGYNRHVPLESGSDDEEEGTEQISDLECLLMIVSKNSKSVASIQTGAK
jgi:hypothetical protein